MTSVPRLSNGPTSPCIECEHYKYLGCIRPEGKCMKRIEWEQQKNIFKEPRVYGYCPLCGVILEFFADSMEEYRQLKKVYACHRCNIGLVTKELIPIVYERGILPPYTIPIPEN